MKLLMRLLREPLLHFFAIGGLIFLIFTAVDDTRDAPADVIVITPERIDQLATGFSAVWKRMPTDDEVDALIDEEVREEVYPDFPGCHPPVKFWAVLVLCVL